MKREAATQGWWRASDGYWYPPDARPGEVWQGEVMGPNGEEPPGPGWWLANDYQWYPPDARPGELWREPVAGTPHGHSKDTWTIRDTARNDAALLTSGGLVLIILGIVLLSAVRYWQPDAGTAVRLLAWLPVAVGSSVTLVGAMRYLGLAK